MGVRTSATCAHRPPARGHLDDENRGAPRQRPVKAEVLGVLPPPVTTNLPIRVPRFPRLRFGQLVALVDCGQS